MKNGAGKPNPEDLAIRDAAAARPWTDRWCTLSINARRFIDFVMIEHMRHGGRANGFLKATYDQLEAHGIGRRLIRPAIAEAEAAGFVECHRGGMRVATLYGLTWLESCDPPTTQPASARSQIQKSGARR